MDKGMTKSKQVQNSCWGGKKKKDARRDEKEGQTIKG